MEFNIRIANEKDFEKIHALNKEFSHFIQTPEKFTITIDQMKEEKDLFKILVIDSPEEGIIGFATTFIVWYSWTGKSMYLDDIYIKEEYRKKGLGSRLMDEVINMAKQEGCKKMRWKVSKWNTNAIEFYKKKGAEIDDVEINCDLSI